MRELRFGYYIIIFASIVIVLAGIKSASAIIVPFLLSLFIAIILSPAYNYLQKKSIPSGLALLIVIFVFVLFLAAIATLIGNSVQSFSANIDHYTQQLSSYYLALSHMAESLGLDLPADEFSSFVNTKQIMIFVSSMLKGMGSVFTNGFVILLTVVFMLLETKSFNHKIDMLDNNKETKEHIQKIVAKIKEYMTLKAIISLFTGLVVWIALVIIGTDYAFLWAVLAFLFNFIPNIGSIIAAVPAVLITLVQLGPASALIVTLLYIGINVIIGSIIEPRVMGKGLGLSTLVVFLSLLFWGWLLGMVGMLLSIPLTMMVKIIMYENNNTRWVSILLDSGNSVETKVK